MVGIKYLQRLLQLEDKLNQSGEDSFTEARFIEMAIAVGFSCDQAQNIFNESMSDKKPLSFSTVDSVHSVDPETISTTIH